MKKLFFLVFGLFLAFSSSIKAQGFSTDGKDFYVGFIYPSFNRVIPAFSAGFFRVYAIICSYQDNIVYVSYFNEDGTEETAQPYKIQARKAVQIPLSVAKLQMTDPGDLIKEYRSLHITSKKPVTVQFFSTGASACGMYSSIPTTLLGKKYVIGSFYDNPKGELAMLGGRGPTELDVACGYFQVIGTENGTTVTITPTSTTQGGKHVGVTNGPGSDGTPHPYSISLNRGQCYMVKSHCAGSDNDITGSIVESDKPVAVISGHENVGIGSVGTRSLEGRDYMVEQMIPVAHWDNTGYVSIPFVDSDPYNSDGTGDNYRAIVYDSTENIRIDVARTGKTADKMELSRYSSATKYDIEQPIDFSSGMAPFMVYQMDQANQSSKQPFPRPSMMQIVPMSRWKNTYLWFVPSNVDERLQAYYINIIGPKAKFDSIFISKGGQKEVVIGQAGFGLVKEYDTIPNHPELKGKTFKVVPGSYYASASFPFVVYQFGNRAIDADGDLGDLDNDDNFFAYATPLGYQLISSYNTTTNMSVKVDTTCSGWKVCVTDNTPGGWIRSAWLIDDAEKEFIVPPAGVVGYKYVNTTFDTLSDPDNDGEILVDEGIKTYCFTVNAIDVTKEGYAPISIVDKNYSYKVVELFFKKQQVEFSVNPTTGKNYGQTQVGIPIDDTIVFRNLSSSNQSYFFSSANFLGNDSSFKLISVTPAPPMLIEIGDSVTIAYRYTPQDTTLLTDTLRFVTGCFTTDIPLTGVGASGAIYASDVDLGTIAIGKTSCSDDLLIRNTGTLPFTLGRNFLLQDTAHFKIDKDNVIHNSTTKPLPLVLNPREVVRLNVCYIPTDNSGTDSTAVIWETDLAGKYKLLEKSFTILRAKSTAPIVEWDRSVAKMKADSTQEAIVRVYLQNKSTVPTMVTDIYLKGQNVSEFRIIDKQNVLTFGMDPNSTSWVDIGFTPNMQKSDSLRLLDRHAEIVATVSNDGDLREMKIIAGFNVLKVNEELRLEELRIHPNPTLGEDITASFGLIEPKELRFMIYDMLGREVLSVPPSHFAKGEQTVTLPVSKLAEGGYILHVSDGTLTRNISFRVVK